MSWQDLAACKGQPTNLFFPGSGQSDEKAKAICKGCPVRQECLNYSLKYESTRPRFGVYGGLTASDRNELFGVPHTVPGILAS